MRINSFKQNYWILTIELSLKYLRRRKMVSISFVSNGICSSVWFSMDCKKMSVELVCNTLHTTCSRKYDLNNTGHYNYNLVQIFRPYLKKLYVVLYHSRTSIGSTSIKKRKNPLSMRCCVEMLPPISDNSKKLKYFLELIEINIIFLI